MGLLPAVFVVWQKRLLCLLMMYRFFVAIVLSGLLATSCRTSRLPVGPPVVTSAEAGLLTCFSPGVSLNGQPVWCEASAVAFDGNKVLLANDKDMPASLSPVFAKTTTTLADSIPLPAPVMTPAFASAHKYEDFAQTPNGRFVLLTTAFDRVKTNSHDWDGYNTILYWRKGDEQHPHVLATNDTSRTSVAYRQPLARVLADADFPDAMPYFKVEGLAATDSQLLFGIREVGKAYDSFKPVAKIVTVSYKVVKTGTDERMVVGTDWKLLTSFDPASAEPSLPQPLSLSSLEYDSKRNGFWLLTSLETTSQLDAWLWFIRAEDLFAGKPFALIRDGQGQPVRFGHKAEDLTPLDARRLLIIHDDDRMQTTVGTRTRQPNQAAYTILTLK